MSTPSPIQREHGHSPIAHPILEALALSALPASELKIVLAVIRETYGWSRKEATLSMGALAGATALHRTTVQRAIHALLKAGVLVEVSPASFRGPATYRLQKDPREWGPFSVTPPSLVAPAPGRGSGTATSQRTRYQAAGARGGSADATRGGSGTATSSGVQHPAPQALTGAENKGKQDTESKDSAERTISDAQQLTNHVLEHGQAGEPFDNYGRQAGRAKQILRQQPLDYWIRAAGAMAELYPYSHGTAWDVFDLGRLGAKALASAKKARASGNGSNGNGRPAEDREYVLTPDEVD